MSTKIHKLIRHARGKVTDRDTDKHAVRVTHTHRIRLAWRIIVFRHEYVRLHTCENVSMCVHENVRTCVYMHVSICNHAHMRARVHARMRVRVYVCASGMQRS